MKILLIYFKKQLSNIFFSVRFSSYAEGEWSSPSKSSTPNSRGRSKKPTTTKLPSTSSSPTPAPSLPTLWRHKRPSPPQRPPTTSSPTATASQRSAWTTRALLSGWTTRSASLTAKNSWFFCLKLFFTKKKVFTFIILVFLLIMFSFLKLIKKNKTRCLKNKPTFRFSVLLK